MYVCMYVSMCTGVFFCLFDKSCVCFCRCSVVGIETCMPSGIAAKVGLMFGSFALFVRLFSLSS